MQRRSVSNLLLVTSFVWCAAASAQVPPPHTTRFDLEAVGGGPDVFLTSSVSVDLGAASLRYQLDHTVRDMLLDVVWKGQAGNVLLHGGNGFGFLNRAISLDIEWVGVFFPTVNAVLLQGTADFTNTRGNTLAPCLAGRICRADYYDWPHNAGSGSGGGGAGGGAELRSAATATTAVAATTNAAAATASALPSGFESVTETRSTISGLVAAPTPTDPFATRFDAMFRFSSRIEPASGGFRYIYSATNLTGEDMELDIPQLDFDGTLPASGELVKEVFSASGPMFLLAEPGLTNEFGAVVSARFDALVPVPEPAAVVTMIAGLLLVLLAARGRYARARARG